MKVMLLSIIAALLACSSALAEKKIVCYFSNWSVYRQGRGQFNIQNIEPNLCTHLVYTYAGININGEVNSLDPYADLPEAGGKDGYGQFNRLRLRNNRIKTFIAIGGYSESSAVYSHVARYKREIFVQNAIRFVRNHGFDGMSFDWQYPNQRGGVPADRENYIQLLKELREGFDRAGLLLMATVGAAYYSADQSYNIPEMVKYLDTINLMTFDFHGPWDGSSTTNMHSALFPRYTETGFNKFLNVNETLNYWLNHGAPAHKLIMGIPAYGRSYTLRNPHNNGVGAPTTGAGNPGPYTLQAGFLGYNEIVEILPGCVKGYNSDQAAWYAYKGDQWFDYEETGVYSTIRQKVQVLKNLGLGGAMLYNIDTDDFLGNSYPGIKYPLLKAINRELLNYVPPSSSSSPVPPSPVDPCDLVCREVGYLRDPYDCALFYRCVPNGASYVRKQFYCPSNLVFDLTSNVCNYREQVNCSGCKL